MQGICGVVRLNGSTDSDDAMPVDRCLAGMMDILRDRDGYRQTSFQSPVAGMGGLSLDGNNGVAHGDGVALAVLGEVVEQERLWGELPGNLRGEIQPALPELLLRRFQAAGADGLTGLNGIHVIAVWEAGPRRLTLVTDRLGARRLYYWQKGNLVLFASEYRAIIGHPKFSKRINERAVAEFVEFGYLLGEENLLENIYVAPEAATVTFEDGQKRQRSYWQSTFDEDELKDIDLDEYVDEMGRLYRQAVSRRMHDKLCLQTTGGLDSRSIAGFAAQCRTTETIRANTIGFPGAYDVVFGGQIARDIGVPHDVVPVPENFLEQYAVEATRRTEGQAILHSCWRMAADDWIRQNDIRHVMNGFMATTARGPQKYIAIHDAPDMDTAFDLVYSEMRSMEHELDFGRLFTPDVYKRVKNHARSWVRSYFDSLPYDQPLFRFYATETHTRERRYISCHIDYLAPLCRTQQPIADTDLQDFLRKMPWHVRKGETAYKRMVSRHIPKAARAPYLKTGLPVAAGPMANTYHRLRRAVRFRALPKLTLGRLGTKNRNAFVEHAAWLRTASREYVYETMREKERLADFFDMDYVDTLIDDHMAGRARGFGPVYILVGLIHWHRMVMDGIPAVR